MQTERFIFIAEEKYIDPYSFQVEEKNEALRTLGKLPNIPTRQHFVKVITQLLHDDYKM